MKRLGYLTVLLLVITAHPFISHSSSGPRIFIQAKEFNFKEVHEGQVITHTFKVLNKGDQRLEINRVNPG